MTKTSKNPTTHPEPLVLRRRIGSTDFEIAVFFSDTTLNDKIRRLIKSEARKEVKN